MGKVKRNRLSARVSHLIIRRRLTGLSGRFDTRGIWRREVERDRTTETLVLKLYVR